MNYLVENTDQVITRTFYGFLVATLIFCLVVHESSASEADCPSEFESVELTFDAIKYAVLQNTFLNEISPETDDVYCIDEQKLQMPNIPMRYVNALPVPLVANVILSTNGKALLTEFSAKLVVSISGTEWLRHQQYQRYGQLEFDERLVSTVWDVLETTDFWCVYAGSQDAFLYQCLLQGDAAPFFEHPIVNCDVLLCYATLVFEQHIVAELEWSVGLDLPASTFPIEERMAVWSELVREAGAQVSNMIAPVNSMNFDP